MEQDLAQVIFNLNKNDLTYCEIDSLLIQLKEVKPHLNILQQICSQHKHSSIYCGQFNGATIIIRVFDTQLQIKKSLKIFFLDRFGDKSFTEEIFHLFESSKNILKPDIILQIYDTYFISLKNKYKAFLVVEQEDIEDKLYDYINIECQKKVESTDANTFFDSGANFYNNLYNQKQKENFQVYPQFFAKENEQKIDFPKEIEYVMKTTINFCSNRINIKLQSDIKRLTFPQDYIKYFYIIKGVNGEIKIKINLLSTDLFINPLKNIVIKKNEPQYTPIVQKNESKFEQLNKQLKNIESNVQNFSSLKKRDLIRIIQEQGQQLLKYHDIQVFEIIVKNPKYDDFELIEFDQNYFVIGSIIQDQNFYLKAERFLTQQELDDASRKYDQYYQIENHMFIPVENHEQIVFKNNFYLLIQERVLQSINIKQNDYPLNQDFEYQSLEQILKKEETSQKEQLRYLQIVVQLIRFVISLQQHEIYHGQLKHSNIIVHIPILFTSRPPQIFVSNPLFLRNNEEKNTFQQDISQIENIISQLQKKMKDFLIDPRVLIILFSEISQYLQYLNEQYTKNIEKQQNILLFNYISRLEYLFKVFQEIYINENVEKKTNNPFQFNIQEQHKQIKLNKKWLVSLTYYENMYGFGFSRFENGESCIDQFSESKLLQMVEKVKCIIGEHKQLNIVESLSKNVNIISLNLKKYQIKEKDDERCANNSIENIFRNCKKLQKVKLDIYQDQTALIDFSLVKDLPDLKFIKIILSLVYNLSNEEKLTNIISQFKKLDDVFQSNTSFIFIDIYLAQESVGLPFINEDSQKFNFIYSQIFNNLTQSPSNQSFNADGTSSNTLQNLPTNTIQNSFQNQFQQNNGFHNLVQFNPQNNNYNYQFNFNNQINNNINNYQFNLNPYNNGFGNYGLLQNQYNNQIKGFKKSEGLFEEIKLNLQINQQQIQQLQQYEQQKQIQNEQKEKLNNEIKQTLSEKILKQQQELRIVQQQMIQQQIQDLQLKKIKYQEEEKDQEQVKNLLEHEKQIQGLQQISVFGQQYQQENQQLDFQKQKQEQKQQIEEEYSKYLEKLKEEEKKSIEYYFKSPYVKFSEVIQFLDNNQVLESILNKDIMGVQIKQAINSYFKLFQTEIESVSLHQQENKLQEEIKKFINEYQQVYCFAYTILETNRKLLVFEFNHIFIQNFGKFIIKFQINSQNEFEIVSHHCQSYERFICHLKIKQTEYTFNELIVAWMNCEYISELKKSIFQQNEKQSCSHYDRLFMQRRFYQNQQCLKNLTIYIELCDIIVQQMKNTINYFQFSKQINSSLIELSLQISEKNINSFGDRDLMSSTSFFKSLRLNLECIKSLIKINLGLENRLFFLNIERSLKKMKRIVVIKFNQHMQDIFRE